MSAPEWPGEAFLPAHSVCEPSASDEPENEPAEEEPSLAKWVKSGILDDSMS
jgi:hypothetical protein